MNPNTQAVIDENSKKSHTGTIDFGTVVANLMAVGVESYHADYRRGETTYYLPGGETHITRLPATDIKIADAFSAEAVQAAVRGAQAGRVKYPQFVELTMAAGCVGYMVWIAGRHVQYLGRRGEFHVEHFPGSN